MFRFLELELHGWDFWQPLRIPLDARIVVLSGPNGAGKTTMLDAIRQILNAGRLSQNRRLSHYLRVPNEPALLRAVVSNRADERGRRPFERQKVVTDEATLACALVLNGGSPEKRFAVLPGRVGPRELQKYLLEGRDWLQPDQYRRVLENGGVSRSLMHILALEQGRADELSHQKPRDLFKWVMEARGAQQVLDRYTIARRRYEDSIREVDRQNAQVHRYQVELSELERKVRRLDEYIDKKARVKTAEDIKAAAPLQACLTDLRDIERKLPELRTKSANLATTSERLQREMDGQQALVENLKAQLQTRNDEARKATEESDQAIADHARLLAEAGRLERAAAELGSIPEEDVAQLEKEIGDARAKHFRAEQLRAEYASALEETKKAVFNLDKGVRRYPAEVSKTLDSLSNAGVKAFLIAERVEIANQSFSTAVESALANLRYAICVDSAQETRAAEIARGHGFLGPIVSSDTLTQKLIPSGPVQFTDRVPKWIVEWAENLRLFDSAKILSGTFGIAEDGTRRDSYGIWVSQAPDRVLGGSAIRHQLEQARRERERLTRELAVTDEDIQLAAAQVAQVEARLACQRRRTELLQMVGTRVELEKQLATASESSAEHKKARDRANNAAAEAQRAVLNAEMRLQDKKRELAERLSELTGTRAAVSEMEQKTCSLEFEIDKAKAELDPELVRQAERGELPSLVMAEKDLERAQLALKAFEAEGEIPPETVRDERIVLQGNLEDLVRHVQDRQREADSARTELDQCRADYLNVIRSTLHDYSKRARALAEMASAKLEIELPDLRNDDRSLDEAGILVRIGFDGKPPTEIGDTGHSGGQQVVAGLILLMSMAEIEGDSFFILDEPFAHLSLDRVDDVGKFLRRSGAQFLITVPTTLDRGQLDPASLLVVLRKKPADALYAPSPIVARAE